MSPTRAAFQDQTTLLSPCQMSNPEIRTCLAIASQTHGLRVRLSSRPQPRKISHSAAPTPSAATCTCVSGACGLQGGEQLRHDLPQERVVQFLYAAPEVQCRDDQL